MSGSISIDSRKKVAVLIPLGLFLAAFLIRLVGITWGLPNDLRDQSYHPDETINYAVSQSNLLSPGFYNYGTAYFMAERFADTVVEGYAGGPSGPDLKSAWMFIGRQILVGRVVSALAGAGCVVAIWLILRRITTQFGALFGVAVVGIAPGFLVHSRFETVDVFGTFWIFLSALFALRILGAFSGSIADGDQRNPTDFRDALLAGAFAGIATGTKYTGVLVLLVLWLVLALTRRPGWIRAGIAGGVACFVLFWLTTPGFLLDSARFWRDFDFELGHAHSGHGLVFAGTPSGFVFHLGNLAVGVGALLTLGGLAGLLYAAYRKHRWAIALLAFGAVYYVAIGSAEVKFLRYTFPLLLPISAGFGYAMGTSRRRAGWGHAGVAMGIFAIAGIDFGGLSGAVRYTQYMSVIDPRDEAALYLKRVAVNGTVGVAKDPWFYTPPLIPDAGVNRNRMEIIWTELAQSENPKLIRYLPPEGPDQRIDWDARLLTEAKPDYVVLSSFEVADEQRLSQANELDAATQTLVDHYNGFTVELEKTYKLDSVFGVPPMPAIHDLMYIHPTIWVWKRK